MRITQSMLDRNMLGQLNSSMEQLSEAQKKLASEKKVEKPSDDPSQVNSLLEVRAEIKASDRYTDNINSALLSIGQATSSVGGVYDLLAEAKQLAVQSASSSGGGAASGLAEQMDGIISNALDEMNGEQSGGYIFAGTASDARPFSAVRGTDADGKTRVLSVTYSGNGDVQTARVSDSAEVATGVSGSEVEGGLFATLISLRQALASGASTAGLQDQLDAQMARLDDVQARLGASSSRLATMKERLSKDSLQLEERRSSIEDADLAEQSVEQAQKSAAYQATLAAVAKRAQMSLINYL